jgi:hypothetical protein
MDYELTDEYIAEARKRAYRYQGQWTGTAGSLAADVARLIIERKKMQGFLTDLESSNAQLRAAVENRLAGQPSVDETDAAGGEFADWMRNTSGGCCDGGKCHTPEDKAPERWREITQASAEKYAAERFLGSSLLTSDVHPTSQAFYDLCDAIKDMHRRKSSDYGCPSGTDPLANIRNGAKFVGIPAWKAAMVRLSDKVTRLATYNVTGRLENESLEDNLFDLASYSLLALLLHREERDT